LRTAALLACSLELASAEFLPYATNPTLGKRVPNGHIVVDGKNTGEWGQDTIVALDKAGDDARTLGKNWATFETPWDLSHLYSAWDDEHVYLAWQYVDITDVIDPANAGSSAGTKPNQQNLIQSIAIDTIPRAGAATDMWGKNYGGRYWTGADLPDFQIYIASNLWQGYISQAVDGKFVVCNASSPCPQHYRSVKDANISVAASNTLASQTLWGVESCNDRNDTAKLVDFVAKGHDGKRDTFYEMAIPFKAIGFASAAAFEQAGLGLMLFQGEGSPVDSIPQDEATTNTPGVSPSNSPNEWTDVDHFTSPFARVGKALGRAAAGAAADAPASLLV